MVKVRRREHIADVPYAERVVTAERHTVTVLVVVGDLQGVVPVPGIGPGRGDGAEAAVGAQQFGGERRGARHSARSERGVLILRLIGRAEVRGVLVHGELADSPR